MKELVNKYGTFGEAKPRKARKAGTTVVRGIAYSFCAQAELVAALDWRNRLFRRLPVGATGGKG